MLCKFQPRSCQLEAIDLDIDNWIFLCDEKAMTYVNNYEQNKSEASEHQ